MMSVLMNIRNSIVDYASTDHVVILAETWKKEYAWLKVIAGYKSFSCWWMRAMVQDKTYYEEGNNKMIPNIRQSQCF